MSSPSPRSPKEPIRSLASLGIAGCLVFTANVIALHGLQPDLSPLTDAVSYYVHGPYGWLVTLGLIALGIGSLAITLVLATSAHQPHSRVGLVALALWGLGALLGGVFPADPMGTWDRPPSLSGSIHGFSAMIAIVAFPIAAVALTRSMSRDSRWRPMHGVLRATAGAVVVTFIAFAASLLPVFVTSGPPFMLGLTERVMLAAYVVWLIVATALAASASGGLDAKPTAVV